MTAERGRTASTEAPPPVTTFTPEEELMRESGEASSLWLSLSLS